MILFLLQCDFNMATIVGYQIKYAINIWSGVYFSRVIGKAWNWITVDSCLSMFNDRANNYIVSDCNTSNVIVGYGIDIYKFIVFISSQTLHLNLPRW